jgi:hypothetical protein
MALYQYRTVLLIVLVVSGLLVASPALEQLIVYPKTDPLTEFYLYGSNHSATYPSNVTADHPIELYLCGSNHMGELAYYQIEVKFRNISQSGPDSFNHTASKLLPLATLTAVAADNSTFEIPIEVSFQYKENPNNPSQLIMNSITINGNVLPLNATSIEWDANKAGFYGNLFFELWLYSPQNSSFSYHERYIGLWLRMET